MEACKGESVLVEAAGTSLITFSRTSLMPVPSLALIHGAEEASMPIISSISFHTRSGSAWSKSILFNTGIMVSPSSTALKQVDKV